MRASRMASDPSGRGWIGESSPPGPLSPRGERARGCAGEAARLVAGQAGGDLAQDLLRLLGALLILLLHLLEELHQIVVARLLGVLDVLLDGAAALQGVVEHADQVVDEVGGAGRALSLGHAAAGSRGSHAAGQSGFLLCDERRAIMR